MISSQRRVVLVGGSGFLGTRLAEYLEARNYSVQVLSTRFVSGMDLNAPFSYTTADLERGALDWVFDGAWAVIDLSHTTTPASAPSLSKVNLDDNVRRALGVMERSSAANVEVYVYVSSGGAVYGNCMHEKISEVEPCAPISGYGLEKLFAENAAKLLHRTAGLDVRVLRPSNPYGPAQIGERVQGLIGYLIHAMKNGDTIKQFGDATKDYIYIDDLIEGFVSVLERGEPGEVYNLGSEVGLTTSKLILKIAEFLSIDPASLRLERLPRRNFDPERNVLNTSKARRRLEWEPKIDLSEGLAKMCAFANAEKME